MEEVKNNLEKRGLSSSSINLYIKNLMKLNDNKPFKNLKFLKSISTIEEELKKYKPNTQRTFLISIVSSLKGIDEKLYKKYYDLMLKINNDIKEQPKNEKTDEQKKNWVSKEEINNKREELKKEVLELKKPLSKNEYKKVLEFILLSLYSLTPPRRNKDYYDMLILEPKKEQSPEYNYFDNKNKVFIFNNYKTSNKYGVQKINIPDELYENILIYLKLRPDYKGIKSLYDKQFLISYDNDDFNYNTITRLLNGIFKKNIGASLIRHIYLSEKYKDTIEEQEEDAKAMGHSVSTQKEYIKK
jgi:integrase